MPEELKYYRQKRRPNGEIIHEKLPSNREGWEQIHRIIGEQKELRGTITQRKRTISDALERIANNPTRLEQATRVLLENHGIEPKLVNENLELLRDRTQRQRFAEALQHPDVVEAILSQSSGSWIKNPYPSNPERRYPQTTGGIIHTRLEVADAFADALREAQENRQRPEVQTRDPNRVISIDLDETPQPTTPIPERVRENIDSLNELSTSTNIQRNLQRITEDPEALRKLFYRVYKKHDPSKDYKHVLNDEKAMNEHAQALMHPSIMQELMQQDGDAEHNLVHNPQVRNTLMSLLAPRQGRYKTTTITIKRNGPTWKANLDDTEQPSYLDEKPRQLLDNAESDEKYQNNLLKAARLRRLKNKQIAKELGKKIYDARKPILPEEKPEHSAIKKYMPQETYYTIMGKLRAGIALTSAEKKEVAQAGHMHFSEGKRKRMLDEEK